MIENNKAQFISVIIPCRNEEKYIAQCLDSILNTDYPSERIEILVIDGMSEDGTRNIVNDFLHKNSDIVKLLDNEKKILASAWNIGIRMARGDIILTLNAHGVFPKEYITLCVNYLSQTDADYVGGRIITLPQDDTYLGNSIAVVLSSRFGVGWSNFRVGVKTPIWTDTAAFGGYRKSVFERVGLFNESLVRSQDMDFHLRMKEAGCKILLVPDMVCRYYIRSKLGIFLRDYLSNGFWAVYPLKFNPKAIYWRHLIPFFFVYSVAFFGILSFSFSAFVFKLALWAIIGLYLVFNIFFSIITCIQRKCLRYLPVLPIVYTLLHFCYGMGSLWGMAVLIFSKGIRKSHTVKYA